MPKVITYSDAPAFLQMPDGNEYSEGSEEANNIRKQEEQGAKWRRRGVQVGWVKGRSVELGVALFDPSREQPSDGIFISLDRDGIQRLIRSLRDGRDAVYGKDV